jgi:RPA family protein
VDERPTAIPITIADINSGSFVQQEDAPSTLILSSGTNAGRIRIGGIVVAINELVIDDGTGSMLIRTFDTTQSFAIGDSVIVIGKPRAYQNQPYVLGEIIKKTNPKWIEYWKKKQPKTSTKEAAINAVRKLDRGDGADYNEVITSIGAKGEELIIHLLTAGELFETRPGKLKVLE